MPRKDKASYNEYMKNYVLNRYHRRKEDALLLLGAQCEVCGTVKDLEFRHVNKAFRFSKLWGANEDTFFDELKNCRLLCKTHMKSEGP